MTGLTKAFSCEVCENSDPRWRIVRRGDAVVSWACPQHLAQVCERLQRDWEITELVVSDSVIRREWAEIEQLMEQL